jgi:two-component system CheB/CheR fusion protein
MSIDSTAPHAQVTLDDDQPGLPFPVVGIGASAGGLEAYTELLEALPANPGMAFLLVSHLDPEQKSHLPEILGRVSKMPVRLVTDGMAVEKNIVYCMPSGTSMAMLDGHLTLIPRPPKPAAHMPIDHLFRSLATL